MSFTTPLTAKIMTNSLSIVKISVIACAGMLAEACGEEVNILCPVPDWPYQQPYCEQFDTVKVDGASSISLIVQFNPGRKTVIGKNWVFVPFDYHLVQTSEGAVQIRDFGGQKMYLYRRPGSPQYKNTRQQGDKLLDYTLDMDVRQQTARITCGKEWTMNYRKNRLRSITFGNGLQLNYPIEGGITSSNGQQLISCSYDKNRRISWLRADNRSYLFEYDDQGRLAKISNTKKEPVLTFGYSDCKPEEIPPVMLEIFKQHYKKAVDARQAVQKKSEAAKGTGSKIQDTKTKTPPIGAKLTRILVENKANGSKNELIYDEQNGFIVKNGGVYHAYDPKNGIFWTSNDGKTKAGMNLDTKSHVMTNISSKGVKTETYMFTNNAKLNGRVRKIVETNRKGDKTLIYQAFYNDKGELIKEYKKGEPDIRYVYERDQVTVKHGDRIISQYKVLPDGQKVMLKTDNGVVEIDNQDGTKSKIKYIKGQKMTEYVYGESGRLHAVLYQDGTKEIFNYDENGKMTSIKTIKTSE